MLICQPRGASQSVAEVRLVQLRRNAKLALGQSKLSPGSRRRALRHQLVEHLAAAWPGIVRDDRSVESSSARRGTHASVSRVRRQPVGAQAALKSTTAARSGLMCSKSSG